LGKIKEKEREWKSRAAGASTLRRKKHGFENTKIGVFKTQMARNFLKKAKTAWICLKNLDLSVVICMLC